VANTSVIQSDLKNIRFALPIKLNERPLS